MQSYTGKYHEFVAGCIVNVKFGDVLEIHNGIIFDFYLDCHNQSAYKPKRYKALKILDRIKFNKTAT